ncbi:hypothetical protein TSH64_17120 [Azospirillum sp. TSH64]|nr:hypothetical protein TSH64_17120 [Azospirillum sp. TSH64]
MLTGGNRTIVEAMARRMGIYEVKAEVLPIQKHQVVRKRLDPVAGDRRRDGVEFGIVVGIALRLRRTRL